MPNIEEMASERDLRRYWQWVDALITSMESCVHADDPGNVWKYGGYKQFARKYNEIISEVAKHVELPSIFDLYNLDKIPGPASTIALQQKDYFESVHANASLLRAYLRSIAGVDADEVRSLRDFLQARLRAGIFDLPARERDVQNAVEQLLIGRGLLKGQDYDRETGRVKVSAKEVVPDFVFPKLDLALEVKLSSDAARMKAIIDEINADIAAFSKKYKYSVFLVYDIGSIRDEGEFRRDLEAKEGVTVLVIKH